MAIDLIASTIITAIITAFVVFVPTWHYFKKRISKLRELIIEVDEALNDDKVTAEEFRRIWERVKAVFSS